MCLTSVIRRRALKFGGSQSVARSGQKSIAYPCSVDHTVRRALRFGLCQSVARSGQKSIAQGLPWVNSPAELALKGPPGPARIGSGPLDRMACAFPALSGQNTYFWLTQGTPWAKLSCPFGAYKSALSTYKRPCFASNAERKDDYENERENDHNWVHSPTRFP
jgi:hypothetical protein